MQDQLEMIERTRAADGADASARQSPMDVYLPYVDATATGLLRFSRHLVEAMAAGNDPGIHLIIGQLRKDATWVSPFRRSVLWPTPGFRGALMRQALNVVRILWLQFAYPFFRLLRRRRRRATLLLLAHESAPFPWWPQVAVVHDLTGLRRDSGRATLLRNLHHRVWLSGLRRSRRIIAISEATRTDLVARYPDLAARTVVVYEGVDRAIFHDRPQAADQAVLDRAGVRGSFLLYAGTLAPHKNVAAVIPVLGELVRRGHDLQLIVTGKHPPPPREELVVLAEREGVSGRILFPGYVSDADLAALMRGCAAFVFPSLNEGFGLAVVEAMSCGAPVVAAAAGSLPEVVADGGVLLDPHDRAAWTQTVQRILADEPLRQDLRRRAVKRACDFSWARAAEAYRDLCAQANPAAEAL